MDYSKIDVTMRDGDWLKVSPQRAKEIYDIAENDVLTKHNPKPKSYFKNESEYRTYLMNLVEINGYKKAGIKTDWVE